jgi:hypothetical protein
MHGPARLGLVLATVLAAGLGAPSPRAAGDEDEDDAGAGAEADAGPVPLPIFVVPEKDLAGGNGILAVFVAVRPGEAEITVVFADEDHPSAPADGIYDSYRRRKWGRIEDVETFVYEYAEGTPTAGPPRAIRFGSTYSREQRFDVALAEHFGETVAIDRFERDGDRPLLHVNTWNHLFAERSTNPGLACRRVADYEVRRGSRADAEAWVKAGRK